MNKYKNPYTNLIFAYVFFFLFSVIYAESVEECIQFAEKIIKEREEYLKSVNKEEILKIWNSGNVYDHWGRMFLLEKLGRGRFENAYPIVTVPEVEERIVRLLVGFWQFEHREWDPLYRDENNPRNKDFYKLYDKSLSEYGRVWGEDWIEYSKYSCPYSDDEGQDEEFFYNYALLSFNPKLYDYFWFETTVRQEPNYKPLFLAYSDPERSLQLILRELTVGDDKPVPRNDSRYMEQMLKHVKTPMGLRLKDAVETLEIIWKVKRELGEKYRTEIIQFFEKYQLQDYISKLGLKDEKVESKVETNAPLKPDNSS